MGPFILMAVSENAPDTVNRAADCRTDQGPVDALDGKREVLPGEPGSGCVCRITRLKAPQPAIDLALAALGASDDH